VLSFCQSSSLSPTELHGEEGRVLDQSSPDTDGPQKLGFAELLIKRSNRNYVFVIRVIHSNGVMPEGVGRLSASSGRLRFGSSES
jgi:hypothetical protein